MTGSNDLWWGLAWVVVTLLVFTFPLLPGLIELKLGRDAHPIAIDHQDNGDTEYRIKLLAPTLPVLSSLPGAASWWMADHYRVPSGTRLAAARTDRSVTLERNAVADIVISDGMLQLEEGSQVTHLAHAGAIIARGAVNLGGRTSANSLVALAAGSHAFRVAAPCIVTAPLRAAPPAPMDSAVTALTRMPRRHAGTFEVAAGQTLEDSLVVTGDLVLGEGARVVGNVKAHGNVDLAAGAAVIGAVFAGGRIRCAGRNRVQGPMSASHIVTLGVGTVAGSPAGPCSVSAWQIVLGPGVAVFGTLASVAGCEIEGA